MICPQTAPAVGAYVLGALDAEERGRFEEHLAGCPTCAAELDEFRALPAVLDRLRPEDLEPVAVAPSADLFERVSAAAGHRPRRLRTWLVVAAAAVVLAGVGVGIALRQSGPAEQSYTASAGDVEVTLVTSTVDDGSTLDVTVAGMRPGEICRLVAVDRDGERHPAGEWPVSERGGGTWRGWVDVEPDRLTEVVVLGDGAREVVRVPL